MGTQLAHFTGGGPWDGAVRPFDADYYDAFFPCKEVRAYYQKTDERTRNGYPIYVWMLVPREKKR